MLWCYRLPRAAGVPRRVRGLGFRGLGFRGFIGAVGVSGLGLYGFGFRGHGGRGGGDINSGYKLKLLRVLESFRMLELSEGIQSN